MKLLSRRSCAKKHPGPSKWVHHTSLIHHHHHNWRTNTVPIQTRLLENTIDTFRHQNKKEENKKKEFNQTVVKFVKDQQALWETVQKTKSKGKHLVIDGLHLQTTTHLVQYAGVPLKNIHIVCKSIEFLPNSNRCWSGELLDFLENYQKTPSNQFDTAVFDFCGTWNEMSKKCVEVYFSKRLAECASVLIITLCSRQRNPTDIVHYHRYRVINEIQGLAYEQGYTTTVLPPPISNPPGLWFCNDKVYTLYFKVMHLEEVLHKKYGLKQASFIEKWLSQQVKK